MTLNKWGWNNFFAGHFESHNDTNVFAGRVALQYNNIYKLLTAEGEVWAELSGKLRYQARGPQDLPAVGDWVIIRPVSGESKVIIQHVLSRQTKVSRKVAGAPMDEQVLAANINTIFLVMGLDQDFNLRRLERYRLVADESGAGLVIVLNKADLCEAIPLRLEAVKSIAPDVPVVVLSATRDSALDPLFDYIDEGRTVAFLGSSGVGKSTIINRMLGAAQQQVQAVRASDGRGRHTTTNRQLIPLPTGGLLVDTPGMRELQLWVEGETMGNTFADIEAIAGGCRFRNCRHESEPACAIQQALNDGQIDLHRFENYQKLQRERRHLELKRDEKSERLEHARVKRIHRAFKKHKKRL